jgi:hypothetical protein
MPAGGDEEQKIAMDLKFLGQGLRAGTSLESPAGDELAREAASDFSSFLAFVAFMSRGGAEHICAALDGNLPLRANTQLFVGIDLKGTSKEALEILLDAA